MVNYIPTGIAPAEIIPAAAARGYVRVTDAVSETVTGILTGGRVKLNQRQGEVALGAAGVVMTAVGSTVFGPALIGGAAIGIGLNTAAKGIGYMGERNGKTTYPDRV